MTLTDNYVKISFRFHSDIFGHEMVETMWATSVGKGLYKIENIPFYAPSLASDDIVSAEFDEDENRLVYRKTIEYSGNSTIQVTLIDKKIEIDLIRYLFKDIGCTSEKANAGYFSMEVPAALDYKPIYKKLREFRSKGTINFVESWLSDKHLL